MERTAITVVVLELCIVLVPALTGVPLPACSTSQDASCLLNHTCSSDHSFDSQQLDCSREIMSINRTASSYVMYNITECPSGGSKHCANRANEPDEDQFVVKDVTAQVMPVNVSHFSVTVNWEWYDYDYNRSINKLKGYELKVLKGSATVKCLCIREPGLRNISLGIDGAFRYMSSNLGMEVELSTFSNRVRSYNTKCYNITWPSVCSGSSVCLFGLPSAPRVSKAISVLTEGGLKELQLSWTKPASHVTVYYYYIQLLDNVYNETVTAFVNGSNDVQISGLSPNSGWSVQVQGYSPCSGIASFYSGGSNRIGCGDWSKLKVAEDFLDPKTSTSFLTSSSQPSFPYIVSFAVAVPGVLVAVVLAVALCVWFYWRKHKIIYPHRRNSKPVLAVNPAHNDKPGRVDAFVLYSFSAPTHEKIEIEKYIVGFLKLQHFKVISCNDHTEKTIMQWVEENARLAHVVFIVCNKQFFLDWKMNLRPQLVNSLEMIVASAVGQNKIKKYATVLLRPGDDKYIPDNLYFRGMTSFLMGSHATREEKTSFTSFIKLNSSMSW